MAKKSKRPPMQMGGPRVQQQMPKQSFNPTVKSAAVQPMMPMLPIQSGASNPLRNAIAAQVAGGKRRK